jgi:hypothetical protein
METIPAKKTEVQQVFVKKFCDATALIKAISKFLSACQSFGDQSGKCVATVTIRICN